MRRMPFYSLGLILLQALMLTEVGVASTPQALMRLDKPVHMLAADGTNLLLEPGDYTLNPADNWIKVTPLSGTALDSWLMQTQVGTHQETLEGVRAFSVQGENPDTHHIVLLLTDGKKFETIGTYSGIRTRGGFSGLSALRIKQLLKRPRPKPPTKQQPIRLQTGPSAVDTCLNNVAGEFRKIRTHGDKLGFRHTQTPSDYGQLAHSHYQGIQRMGNYLAVSGSASRTGELLIVEMGSRPKSGRLRSNRLSSNTPPASDRVVKVVHISPSLKHAGGFQVVGDVLVVGVEGGNRSEVVFYNVKNPKSPREMYRVSRSGKIGGFSEKPSAGASALVRRPDGRYVLLVGRSDSNVLDLYLSQNPYLKTNSFQHVDSWHERELKGLDREFGNYQNINFIRQCDGQLFFVGLHKNIKIGGVIRGGQDWADLFKFELVRVGQTGQSGTTKYRTVITKIAKRHLYCHDMCDFDAGAGIYVNKKQELFIYGIEHWRHSGIARFNEFRPVPTSISGLTNINQGWVELYDDTNFRDRSVMIDYVDRKQRNYRDYDKVEGFEDKTSSIKWALPSSWQYLLFEDKYEKGKLLRLKGTGRLGVISELAPRGWNDKVSSSRFSPVTITNLNQAWVELYDDRNFKDRRLKVQASSGSKRNYKSITVEGKRGFGDKVSSARYMIPRGHAYRLYEHDSYRGKTLDLVGTGRIEEISNFHSRRFNDKVSSSKFVRR